MIQKIVIADATGNRWIAFDGNNFGGAWPTNGIVEFPGKLWTGENAWRLEVEFSSTSGFSRDELWEVSPLQIPADGHSIHLTNKWESDGMTVELVNLFSSPDTDNLGSDTKSKQLQFSFRVSQYLPGRQLSLVGATDESDRNARNIHMMNGEEYFLNSSEDAHELRLTFALHRSRSVQFLVRPEFVKVDGSDIPTRK